jgi:hypothetical protein
MRPDISKIIACRVVIEELLPILPEGVDYVTLELGLHVRPEELKKRLQQEIDLVKKENGTILLRYGLCSRTVVGLQSQTCSLVVPCVDDCISIFLGSRNAYLRQLAAEPGTYYLTKGWIEAGDHLFSSYPQMVERYGPEKAEWLIKRMLENYTRLVFINTGQYEVERFREYTRQTASRYGLKFEEIHGATTLVDKMVNGPWDDDFVIVPPGRAITYEDFYQSPAWSTSPDDDLQSKQEKALELR